MLKKYLILQVIKTCFGRKKKIFISITLLRLILFTFCFVYCNMWNDIFDFKKQFFRWFRSCFIILVKHVIAFFVLIYAMYFVIV